MGYIDRKDFATPAPGEGHEASTDERNVKIAAIERDDAKSADNLRDAVIRNQRRESGQKIGFRGGH